MNRLLLVLVLLVTGCTTNVEVECPLGYDSWVKKKTDEISYTLWRIRCVRPDEATQ